MAQFQVTASELKAAIAELQDKNNAFKNKVTELEQAQQTLKAQWKGEANDAFSKAFNTDKDKWTTFAGLIDTYTQALQNIQAAYEKAEAENLTTATTRNY